MDAVKEKVKSTIWRLKQPGVKRTLLLANMSACTYYLVMCVICFRLTFSVTLPRLYEYEPSSLRFHRVVFCFLFISMKLNYILSMIKNSNFEATVTNANVNAESASKGWAYCTPCQQYIPPRCHHCIVCEKCVLKRDSHCFFTGHCVGHRNLRYFIVFLFYAALSSLYGVFFLATYVNLYIGPFFSFSIVNFIYPIASFKWMTGSMPGFVYFSLTIFYMLITITCGCIFLFCLHIYHAVNGQTSHEATTGITKYRHASLKNLQDVFGPFWFISFLLPSPFSLPSDGITWSRGKEL